MNCIIREKISLLKGPLVLLGIFIAAILLSPTDPRDGGNIFLSFGNLSDMSRAITPVAIMSLAMTLVILTAGIDLSVGSIVALSSVVTAALLVKWQAGLPPCLHIFTAMGCAILAATCFGALNGAIIARFGIQPFIVTLAAMIGIRGMALWLSNNERIGLGISSDAAGLFADIFSTKTVMIGSLFLLALIFAFLLKKTVFGRYVRAIGDNSLAARYAGLPIQRVLIVVYALSGSMAGIAGVLLCARMATGDPNAGIATELDVIAVVVIGGTSLSGGRGGIGGTILGVLIIGILTNILGLNNVDSNIQLMLKAVIIIFAVAIQQRRVTR